MIKINFCCGCGQPLLRADKCSFCLTCSDKSLEEDEQTGRLEKIVENIRNRGDMFRMLAVTERFQSEIAGLEQFSECPSEQRECECGRVFANSLWLAAHICGHFLDDNHRPKEPTARIPTKEELLREWLTDNEPEVEKPRARKTVRLTPRKTNVLRGKTITLTIRK